MNEDEKPILEALSARFICLEELVKNDEKEAALSVIAQCLASLPRPTQNNLDAAAFAAKRAIL